MTTTTYATATTARETLGDHLAAAMPTVSVARTMPGSVSGPTVVLVAGGWTPHAGQQVAYTVDVHVFHNAPDTTQALRDVETLAAQAWVAVLSAGWYPGAATAPNDATYNGQPFLSVTFPAVVHLDLSVTS